MNKSIRDFDIKTSFSSKTFLVFTVYNFKGSYVLAHSYLIK